MHAIRGSWVGQTFALARCHDSGEKKARIRRSKEERKELVVSFIKKYQFSNKGDFPSLSVTQREVGGSFYTIREIVREIIQENRVLGPAKSTIDEQKADNFFDQHPLGSVAMEPDTDAVSSSEPHVVRVSSFVNPLQNTMESQALDFSQECHELENQKLNDGIIVNGSSYQSERTQGFGGELKNEPPVVRGLVGEDILEKELVISEAKKTQIAADVVIETFPIKPVTDKFALDKDIGEPQVVAGTLEENESGNMDCETVKNVVILNTEDVEEKSSRSVDEKTNSNAEDEEADPSPESLNHSAREISNVLRVNDDRTDLETNEILHAEMNQTSAPNGRENTEAALSSGHQGQSISEEVIATGKKSGIQNGSSSKKSSDPTLDRINLESWEATTDRSGGPQTNPLLSFVKACITAFVKLWSE
ncbi:DNA binding [Heracleum sosnowskyi]|uniref:DNA binding n=1 Tax=Heracleum sosnowskyi TaxID=360622 RepID=A0AAD8J480_9APIA|nr:DNA binding [Heracleum sosnowskyi]